MTIGTVTLKKKTKAELRQEIVAKYREAGQEWPTTSKTMASWAIREGLWDMPRRSAIDLCAKELSEAMREEYLTDPQGRRVRKKHALRRSNQLPLWIDIEDPTTVKDDVEEAVQSRRSQIYSDCRQLKNDVDSYNDNWNREEPILMLWDFTEDLEESELSAEYDGITA